MGESRHRWRRPFAVGALLVVLLAVGVAPAAPAPVQPESAAPVEGTTPSAAILTADDPTTTALLAAHHERVVDVAWRTAAIVGLTLMALLSLGFWIGIGERSYGFLALALSSQALSVVASSGALRLLWPGMGPARESELALVLALLAVLGSLVFLIHYLELRRRQPGPVRIVQGCTLAMAALTVAALTRAAPWVPPLAYLVSLMAVSAVTIATFAGIFARQRAAWFVLVAGLPVIVLLLLDSGAWFGIWDAPAWLARAWPAALVVGGLMIMVGLTDTLQQLRRDHDRASRLATYDGLTGALSRPAMEARLAEGVAQSQRTGTPLSLVFFDVDRFKRINDEHGHRIGDSFLRFIALRTRNRLRTYDLLGRWGGDEMVVMLPDTRLGEALGVAENLRSAVNCRPLSIDGRLFEASLSLGVAELAAGESVEHLVERADSALYSSKMAGRDRVTGHDPRVTGNQPRFSGTAR